MVQGSDLNELQLRVALLEKENARLRQEALERSWRDNPDRMGGSFSDQEIRESLERELGWR